MPYTPYPDIQPTQSGTPMLRVNAPGAAFGETIAQAVEHLGGIGEKAGDELWNRAIALKDVENRAAADQAVSDYMEQSGKLHADFSSKQGFDASNSLDGHIAKLKSTREQIAENLDNPQVKRLFDSESRSVLGRNIFNAAGHAAQQQKVGVDGAASARIDAIKQEAFQNPGDQSTFDSNLATAEQIVRGTKAPVYGWSKEQTDDEVGKVKSSMVMQRILGLSNTQPLAAKKLLVANRGLMRADDWLHAESRVKTQMYSTVADSIAEKYNPILSNDEKNAPVGEKVKDAREEAKKIDDDPMFIHHVETATEALHHKRLEIQKASQQQAFDTVSDTIVNAPPGTSFRQLQMNPDFLRSWDALDKKQQGAALDTMARAASGDYKLTPEVVDRIQTLKGKSNDPDSDFATIPIMNERIPRKYQQEFLKLQKEQRGTAVTDSRVNHAVSILQSDMAANQILKSQNADDYYKFRGALQDALNFTQDQQGKKVGEKEILEIGRRLMQEQHIPGLFGLYGGPFGTKETFFKVKIPDAEVKKTQQEIQAKTGRAPSDDEVQRAFIRKQYIEKYRGPSKQENENMLKTFGK